MFATYGMPYIFQDVTGNILDSSFKEVNDRTKLTIRCVQRGSFHAAYLISNVLNILPPIELIFGANNALGTITVGNTGNPVSMDQYLTMVSSQGSSRVRQFIGSDDQTYTWSWRSVADEEWTCVNSRGYHVASYSFLPPTEPSSTRSVAAFDVEEEYPHLILELLASLTIMRHIALHNL